VGEELSSFEARDLGSGLNIVYAGPWYQGRRDPNAVLDALARDSCLREWRLHLVGSVPPEVRQEIAQRNLGERIVLHGSVGRSDAISIVKGDEVALVLGWNDPKDRDVAGAKVFELIGLKKAIVAMAYPHGVLAEVVQRYGMGHVANETTEIIAVVDDLHKRGVDGEVPDEAVVPQLRPAHPAGEMGGGAPQRLRSRVRPCVKRPGFTGSSADGESELIRRWLASPHLRPIASIASGAALAQLLGVLVAPIVTRLYQPSDYGGLAVYASFVAIGAAVAAGRYESAISLPPDDESGELDAINLVRLALTLAVGCSSLILLAVVSALLFTSVSALEDLGFWALAIPIGVLMSSSSLTLRAYATRRRDYGAIARVAPTQKVVTASVQVGSGLLALGLSGLMFGALATPLGGIGILVRGFRKGKERVSNPAWNWENIRGLARRYSDFPRVGTWLALMNALQWNVHAIALTRYYSIGDVGQYAFALAVVGLPTRMVLQGVSQVYLRECAARVNDRIGAMRLLRKTLKSLFVVSIPLFGAIFVASENLFQLVFGPGWNEVGAITIAMIPLLWARFLVTSLTSTFYVYRRQGILLVWQAVALATTLACIALGGVQGLSVVGTTLLVSLAIAPLYLVLIPISIYVTRREPRIQSSSA